MFVCLKAIFPTEAALDVSSPQSPPKFFSLKHPESEAELHDGGDAQPDEVQLVQLGGDPASLLATKHAKATAQAMCDINTI